MTSDKEVIAKMDNHFSALEEKVMRAVGLIKELRAENGQLREQRDALQDQFVALQDVHQKMSRELDQARNAAASVEHFEDKRRMIEEKVGGLLKKLEEIG